jgi:hypothetical protein
MEIAAGEVLRVPKERSGLWKNGRLRRLFRAALIIATTALVSSAQVEDDSPRLLLTTQRLKRLQRDRTRQTERWINFERRVQTAADSPERGFELALYYAITHDEQRGREAIAWTLQHKCERRQVALTIDWAGDLLTPADRNALGAARCPSDKAPATTLRDRLFLDILEQKQDSDAYKRPWTEVLNSLQSAVSFEPNELYATIEFISVERASAHVDFREDARQFFSDLPTELLLSFKPAELEHPPWMAHAAALALVELDPNLHGSQFLQAWAMEQQQTVREGPGVAYELLWGDPYLPGIAYENLDPWIYDESGKLFARSDWNPSSCWVSLSAHGMDAVNCPTGIEANQVKFGPLTLIPMLQRCAEVTHKSDKDTVILWKMKAKQTVVYETGSRQMSSTADVAGMWRPAPNFNGRVCKAP